MLLSMTDVSKSFRGPQGAVRAVRQVSLAIEPGQFVAVRGPSGCGKSTLLLMAGGLLRPEGGTVLVDGQDPYALSPDARAVFRGRHLGFVFQQFHLVPYLSVIDNILAPTLANATEGARDRAEELIERFGLAHRRDHMPGELSSGERQRTALARALLNRPSLILADEPTGNLDRENADIVLGVLVDFARQGGGVLLVTHDPIAAERADLELRMQDGSQVSESAIV
jgi:ABC-type lipoprotein export system ATPase subunit